MSDVAGALKDAETKMNKAIDVAKEDFAAIRTGRANPALFNKIMVDYYGTYTSLSQLASIQVPEARMAIISPFDKGAMAGIEKAIRESDLGVNPGNDGVVIRVNFPQLTEERRKEIIKGLHKLVEESRVGIRSHRREAIDGIKKREKAKEFSEDEARRLQDEIQKVTDKQIAEIDTLLSAKERELTEG